MTLKNKIIKKNANLIHRHRRPGPVKLAAIAMVAAVISIPFLAFFVLGVVL